MKSIKKLFDDLNNPNLSPNKRYPELLDAPAGNIKILYLGTMLNKTGIYRCILPKLELAKHGYSVIINSIVKDYEGNNFIEHYDFIVKKDLLAWANYVILPTITDDISPLVADIKKINRHAIIVIDLDKNYHTLSQYTSEGVFYDIGRQKKLINNLTQCDAIIAAHPSIADFYDAEIKKHYPEAKPIFLILNNYLSLNLFEDILAENKTEPTETPSQPKKKDSVFSVLIHSARSDFSDVNSNRETLIWLQRIYPQVKLIVFGQKPVWKTKDGLRNVPHTFVEAKSIFEQYKQLHALHPDAAFIPINRTENNYRANFKLLELCALGIPVITYHVPPYTDFDTFVHCGETKKNIQSIFQQALKDPAALPELGKKAHEHVWGNYSYESEGIINYIKQTLR